MKNIIGQVNIIKFPRRIRVQFYVRKKLRKIIGAEFVFNKKTFTFKRPSLDTKKFHTINNSYFSFSVEEDELENTLGLYNVIQKDEDTFILKKVNKDA